MGQGQPRVTVSRRIEYPCSRCPLRAMKTFRKFTPQELQFVEGFKIGEVRLRPGQTLLVEGEDSPYLFTVLDGWLFKYKTIESGRRQILNFASSGDLLGLQAAVFDEMQHNVEAVTPATLCVFDKRKIWTLYERHQGLAFDVTWLAAQEKSILADFLVSAGQRSAHERIAFLLLFLFRKARNMGQVRKDSFLLPLNQDHLADTVGFSLVHTNKRYNAMRRLGYFEWSGDNFKMLDEKAMAGLAGQPSVIEGPKPFL